MATIIYFRRYAVAALAAVNLLSPDVAAVAAAQRCRQGR